VSKENEKIQKNVAKDLATAEIVRIFTY